MKPVDNLHLPEGNFTKKITPEGPTRGERADIKIPTDNLQTGGKFYGKPIESSSAPVSQKRLPIKHEDNLKTEGRFCFC